MVDHQRRFPFTGSPGLKIDIHSNAIKCLLDLLKLNHFFSAAILRRNTESTKIKTKLITINKIHRAFILETPCHSFII